MVQLVRSFGIRVYGGVDGGQGISQIAGVLVCLRKQTTRIGYTTVRAYARRISQALFLIRDRGAPIASVLINHATVDVNLGFLTVIACGLQTGERIISKRQRLVILMKSI